MSRRPSHVLPSTRFMNRAHHARLVAAEAEAEAEAAGPDRSHQLQPQIHPDRSALAEEAEAEEAAPQPPGRAAAARRTLFRR